MEVNLNAQTEKRQQTACAQENTVFGLKREKATLSWRKQHNEEFHNFTPPRI
jgi:hypothetical protein